MVSERNALFMQLTAKTLGETVVCRQLKSRSRQHKKKVLELNSLADFLNMRATVKINQFSISDDAFH